MVLIAIKQNVLINPEKIISIELLGKHLSINLDDGHTYGVDMPTSELMSALSKYGVDLTKQFLAL